jgi:hypothetical protein
MPGDEEVLRDCEKRIKNPRSKFANYKEGDGL